MTKRAPVLSYDKFKLVLDAFYNYKNRNHNGIINNIIKLLTSDLSVNFPFTGKTRTFKKVYRSGSSMLHIV